MSGYLTTRYAVPVHGHVSPHDWHALSASSVWPMTWQCSQALAISAVAGCAGSSWHFWEFRLTTSPMGWIPRGGRTIDGQKTQHDDRRGLLRQIDGHIHRRQPKDSRLGTCRLRRYGARAASGPTPSTRSSL